LLASTCAVLGSLPSVLTKKTHPVPRWALEFAALLPALSLFALLLPMLLLLYQGLGALAWPPTSMAMCMVLAFSLPLLAIASPRMLRCSIIASGCVAVGGLLLTLLLPTFSGQWPQRLNIEYWLDADTHRAHWWVQPSSLHLPAKMAADAQFGAGLQPRFPGISQLGFSAPAESIPLAAPQLDVMATQGGHFELRLRSMRNAATAFVVFPPSAQVSDALLSTPAGPLRAGLARLGSGATVLLIRNLPAEGMVFAVDSPALLPVQVFDQSYGLPEHLSPGKALQSSRPKDATSTQDGDVTVLGRTVR
jgi:hypothetical protein